MRNKLKGPNLISLSRKSFQTFFLRPKRAIRENNLEEATAQRKFDYWLSQEDIADIARIEYGNFITGIPPQNFSKYEIVGAEKHFTSVLLDFKNRVNDTPGGRLTLTINLGNSHWTTLVVNYIDNHYAAYYIDSLGRELPLEYSVVLDELQIQLNNLIVHQQVNDYDCGLWALENAAELNAQLDRKETLGSIWTALNRQRTQNYFVNLRKTFSEKLLRDSIRIARLYSRTEPEEPSSSKRPKTSSSELNGRLETFVLTFINNFTEKLAAYYLNAKGDRLTMAALKNELKIGTTGALVGSAIVQSIAGSIPAVIGSLKTLGINYYSSPERAKKITRLFSDVPNGTLAKLLSEASTEIFFCYENQFMEVSDEAGTQIAMDKLAEDAASRIFDYLYKNSREISLITREIMTKGVVLGKSEKFFDPSVKKVRIRVYGKRILDSNGRILLTSEFFEKTGIVELDATPGVKKFYKQKDLLGGENIGYRRLMSWEKDENGVFEASYQQKYEEIYIENGAEVLLGSDYVYTTFLEGVELKAIDILTKINQPFSQSTTIQRPNPPASLLFDLQRPIRNFFGRETLLNQLHSELSKQRHRAVITQSLLSFSLEETIAPRSSDDTAISLVGLGGIGKTQLALRYAERYAVNYGNNVIWLNAGTELTYSLVNLAVKLGINCKDINGFDKNPESLMEDIYEYFSLKKCLIIFDNVEDYQQIQKFLPKASLSNPTIIITSRYANWNNICPTIAVSLFTQQESTQFIKLSLNMLTSDQDADVLELNQLLYGLPLALQQAVAYIQCQKSADPSFSVRNYVQLFKTKSEHLLSFVLADYNNDPYTKTVLTTWVLTFDKIKEIPRVGKKTIELLQMMAYLYPDNISNTLFRILPDYDDLGLCIHTLRSYSLINEGSTPSTSTIHRLVQKVVRINLEKNGSELGNTLGRLLLITDNHQTNQEVGLHYVYLLLYTNIQDNFLKILSIGSSSRRILLLMDSEFGIENLDNLFDTAKEFYTKEQYLRFIGEAIFTYTRFPLLLLLSTTLNYIEKRFDTGLLSVADFEVIMDSTYRESYGKYLRFSSNPEERRMQLDGIRLVVGLGEKINFKNICTDSRKKRNVSVPCTTTEDQNRETQTYRTTKLIPYLNRINQFSELINAGLFTKSTLTAIVRGDFDTVAFNFSVLAGGRLLGHLAEALDRAETSLTLSEKQIVLNRIIAPFLHRGIALFFAFKITQQCVFNRTKYHCNSAQIVPATVVGLEVLQSIIEAGESLQLIQYLSESTELFVQISGSSLLLTQEAFEIIERIKTLEEHVQLTLFGTIVESIRAFLGLPPSPDVISTAYLNTYIAERMAWLKNHTQFDHYVFSIDNPSEAYLNNKTYLQLRGIIPDEPAEGDLFCLKGIEPITSSRWRPIVPYPPTMGGNRKVVSICKNAIGISFLEARTNNFTLIALGPGDNTVVCNPQASTVIILNNGFKRYQSSNQGDLYVLQGDAFFGELRGGKGIDSVSLEGYNIEPSKYIQVDLSGAICKKNLAHTPRSRCSSMGLDLNNINRIYGRTAKKDVIYITKGMVFIDSGGGELSHKDLLYITLQVEGHLQIVLRSYTRLSYTDETTNLSSIDYLIPDSQSGVLEIETLSNSALEHRFRFESSLDNVNQFKVLNSSLNFILSTDQRKLELTINMPNISSANSFTYQFKNQEQMKFFDLNTLIIKPNNTLNIDQTIAYYSTIATQLDFALTILLPDEEMVLISKQNSGALSNNPLRKSHLVGRGKNKLYLITATEVEQFPIPEIILYRSDQRDSIDILDFSAITQQAQQECPQQKFSITVHEYDQDLIIKLIRIPVSLSPALAFKCTRKIWLSTSVVASIKLKNAQITNWDQQLYIYLNDSLMDIIYTGTHWSIIKALPVVPPNKDKVSLEVDDIATHSGLNLIKMGGQLNFARYNGSDLVITNLFDPETSPQNLITIICKEFYLLSGWRDAFSFKFIFLDQEMTFNEYSNIISNASDFNEMLQDTLNITLPFNEQNISYSHALAAQVRGQEIPRLTLYSRQLSPKSDWFGRWLPGIGATGVIAISMGMIWTIVNCMRQSRTIENPAIIYPALAVPLLQKTSACLVDSVNRQIHRAYLTTDYMTKNLLPFLDKNYLLSLISEKELSEEDHHFDSPTVPSLYNARDSISKLITFSEKGFYKANNCYRFPSLVFKGGFCADDEKFLLWWEDNGRMNWGTISQENNLIERVTTAENYLYITHSSGSTEVVVFKELKVSGNILSIISFCPQEVQKKFLTLWHWEFLRKQAHQIGWHIVGDSLLLHTPIGDLFQKFGLKIDWRSREHSHMLLRWLTTLNHILYPELFMVSTLHSTVACMVDTVTLLPLMQSTWCRFTGSEVTLGKHVAHLVADFIRFGFNLGATLPALVRLYSDSPHLAALSWGLRLLVNFGYQQDMASFYYCLGLFILPQLPRLLEFVGIPVTRYLYTLVDSLSSLFITQSLLTAIDLKTDQERLNQSKLECDESNRRTQRGKENFQNVMGYPVTFFNKKFAASDVKTDTIAVKSSLTPCRNYP